MENNSLFFDIEKSSNGEPYHSDGHMAASGTSLLSHHYTYTYGLTTPGANYYRLKLIIEDGMYNYSDIISVRAGKINMLSVFFNNTKKELQITVSKKDILTIYNVSGQQLQRNIVTAGNNLVSVSALHTGIYLLYSKEYNTVKRFCVFN